MAKKIQIPIEHITDKEQIYNIYQDLMSRKDDLFLVREEKDMIILSDYRDKCMITMSLDENGNIWKIARW